MNIRISTKGKRPLRSLTPSDKIHAIQRIHDGESKASVARDIGVPESTLRGWCKNEDKLRFMSRQSCADKLSSDSLADKLDASVGLLGPPEKRQRLDSSLPLNFSSKMKIDEMTFKRANLNGVDYSTNKALSDLSYNGLHAEYAGFNSVIKSKVFGSDISRPGDATIASISPLSSLTHLSGLTGISQSPLAISFNELTSNFNLLAQLNPGLSAMSGLHSFAATNSLRNVKPKVQTQIQSPRSESGEKQTGLSVKNWAKQKPLSPSDGTYGLNLSQNESKADVKDPNLTVSTQLGCSVPALPGMPDDPLLYWIKSQQNMLGLNSLYPTTLSTNSPPIRSSTPRQQQPPPTNTLSSTPPTTATPLTPLSTPSGSLDDKNAAWFSWCKAFSASLHSLTPNAAGIATIQAGSLQQQTPSNCIDAFNTTDISKASYENILYSHLTKVSGSSSVHSSSSNDISNNIEGASNTDSVKPEDLSGKSPKASSPLPSPIQETSHSVITTSPGQSPVQSPTVQNELDIKNQLNDTVENIVDCKDVLDNILYKINNNPSSSLESSATPISIEGGNESDVSYHSEHFNNNDVIAINNNNNSNKTDEEEKTKCDEFADIDDDDIEAITHGEKFLQWLENCSNPRVTALQLMQLRFLISAIKSGNESKLTSKVCITSTKANLSETEDPIHEETIRNKSRRRK